MSNNPRGTPDTDPPNTNGGNGSGNGSGNGGNGNGRYNRNSSSVVHTNPNNFEGASPDICAVLGLRHEKFKYKAASYESFLEKVSTYAISTFKDGGDLKPLFRKMVNPLTSFKLKKKPLAPVSEDEKNQSIPSTSTYTKTKSSSMCSVSRTSVAI